MRLHAETTFQIDPGLVAMPDASLAASLRGANWAWPRGWAREAVLFVSGLAASVQDLSLTGKPVQGQVEVPDYGSHRVIAAYLAAGLAVAQAADDPNAAKIASIVSQFQAWEERQQHI